MYFTELNLGFKLNDYFQAPTQLGLFGSSFSLIITIRMRIYFSVPKKQPNDLRDKLQMVGTTFSLPENWGKQHAYEHSLIEYLF